MATRLSEKLAVVTGASSGIGAALANALAAEGARVVGFARRFRLPRLLEAPAPGEIAEVQLDMADEAAVRARLGELPALDILVNNAGAFHVGPIVDFETAKLRELLDVHVVGAFVAAQVALRRMGAQHRGHIVFVSSMAAFTTFTGCAGYTAAKEAQRGLVRVLTEEARPLGVRVTGLYPGATATPAWEGSGLDTARMLKAADLASLVVEVLVRPELSVETLAVMPPGGAL